MASPALLRTSAARATTRSIGSVAPSAPRQQLLSTLSKSAGSSSSSSSSSSSKATRATAAFALGASFVVLGLTSSKIQLESSTPADPPAKRVSWSDRVKAHVGGTRIIQRIQEVIEGEDDEEEEAEEESESSSSSEEGSHPLDEEAPLAVEAVAQVVSEDPGPEDSQAAAFDPATGTINWDCPCLGGMAHGPCGEDFKAAFSCFVYSAQEPKGIECVDKFKAMQDCFRRHPEVYKEELEMEEQDAMDSLVSEVEQALGVERSQSS